MGMAHVAGDAAESSSISADVEFTPLENSTQRSKKLQDNSVPCNGDEKQRTKACWSSLFSSDREQKLKFHQPRICDGKKIVYIPKSVHNQGLIVE